MRFAKCDELSYFDWYPRVLAAGKKIPVTIHATGGRDGFTVGENYSLSVCSLDGGNPAEFPAAAWAETFVIPCTRENEITVDCALPAEGEYFLRWNAPEGRRLQLPVYAVEGELLGRYPWRGDLHMHTCRSDGRQIPAVVCADYRSEGYDFTVISDHCRYYPSLEAREAYKDVPLSMEIVPGEEVHLPAVGGIRNAVHIVNFGGEYSVNALAPGEARDEKGTDPAFRSLEGKCPQALSQEEFEASVKELMDTMEIPAGIDPVPAAMCKWIFREIHRAGGLGIFAHPNWIANMFHVPEKFTDYIMKEKDFDAFEVLGGENYYEQNGFQTHRYYSEMAKGNSFPVVGSTDSHSCLASNRNAAICSTLIFAPCNERKMLIAAVKENFSLAVDTISTEFRLVGPERLARYGCFLLKYVFPLHDELCYEEGKAMRRLTVGTATEKEEAAKELQLLFGRVERLWEKLFAVRI